MNRPTADTPRHAAHPFLVLLVSAALVAFAAILVMLPHGASADSTARPETARQLRLITSFEIGPVWFPLNPPEELRDARDKFENAIKGLKFDAPDALLVDLGGFTTMESMRETGYYSRPPRFFPTHEYTVVNMTAKDYFQFHASGVGLGVRPTETFDLFLSSLNTVGQHLNTPMPAVRTVMGPTGRITFASIADTANLAGVPVVVESAAYRTPKDVLTEATEDADGLVIVFSDFPASDNDAFALEHPRVDLILETRAGPATARNVGRTFLIPRGEPGELQVLTINLRDDRRIERVTATRPRWMEAEDMERMINPPLPRIGMGVPGEGRLAQRLNVSGENVTVDIIPNTEWTDVTSRRNLSVYQIRKDDKPYRVWRVYHNFSSESWNAFDVLLQVNPDNTIAHVETNLPEFMILHFPTRLGEILNANLNKPFDEWDIPTGALAGYERQGNEALRAIEATLRLDAALYPHRATE
jgi:hypothetical protein